MRRGLHEAPETLVPQRLNGRSEPHGLAHVPVPVFGGQLRAVDPLRGDRGKHRQSPRSRSHRCQCSQNLLAQRLHLRGMTRPDHSGNLPRLHTALGEPAVQLPHRVRIAGHRHRPGPVHPGHRQPVLPRRDQPEHFLHRQRHDQHRPLPGERLDCLRAQRDHARAVGQRQRAGYAGGSDLPLRVAHHRRRADPVRLPHPGQGDHDRPQHRLVHIQPVQARRSLGPADHRQQVPLHEGRERITAFGHRVGEHPARVQQIPPHARPLRSLPREHENHTIIRGLGRHPAHNARIFAAIRHRAQAIKDVVVCGTEHHGPMFQRGARGRQRRAQVRKRRP